MKTPNFMQPTFNHQALRAELFKLQQRTANKDGMLAVIEYRINQIKEMLNE